MRNHTCTRTFETLSPFDALSSIVMSSDFHFNFLKSFSKVNGVEIVCDWFLDETQTRLVRKTKVHVFNNQYCALLEEQLIFNDEFEFEKENSCHNTELEMMRIVFTISILEKESKPFPGTLSISGMFLFNQEKNFKFVQNFDLNENNKIEENYFMKANHHSKSIPSSVTTSTSTSLETTTPNTSSNNDNNNNHMVTHPSPMVTTSSNSDSLTQSSHNDDSHTVRFGTNEITIIDNVDDVDFKSKVTEPPFQLGSHHDQLLIDTSGISRMNHMHDDSQIPIQTNVSVTISIQLDYKVMIFGNVNSIEEKLCKQCAKLFDLWFTKALQVENSLKPLAGSSQSLRKSQQNHQTSHTISTSKPSRALHKTMMTSSFFTLRSRSVFREHNKRRSLPMRPPPMVVNQQLLQEWITDPNNNVWENPLDPTSDYLETIPQKYLAKHDLHQVDQEVELNDMIFDFLHVSKSSSSSTKSKQDEPSGGNLYHSDDKDPARHENFNNNKTNRDEEEQRQAQSCTCCCLC